MTLSLTLALIWVLASTIVAFLPVERQFRPGGLLLATAPLLIWGLARDFGPVAGILALGAFVSMYRNPLRFLWARMRSRLDEGPAE
ncbi:DUF2484 family protein [Marinibacterium profundimaris]|uniref:UDP-N-acetylmuramate--alanine ligase n=1 Tax=Marinibacterium profundimaris TaxID=1679460 RepID=A0A225NT04_9RHOB|nr:DUF2484 family protein [Marinibacterium profundimaris]OWU77975.1 hypothetical protein ATO3_04925 [Marinibacterium profundimaris]